MEIEISQDSSKQSEDSIDEAAEVPYLRSEEQVAELGKGEEHNEEHDGKASNIFGTPWQSWRQLCHSLVEGDIFEQFEPCKEDTNSYSTIELRLPVPKELKVSEGSGILQKFLQFALDSEGAKYTEANAQQRYQNY